MARRNSRFVNQKVIIGNKSVQAGDLTDSAKNELIVDSDFVKTVDGLDGSKISDNSISPASITNQGDLIASAGGLTTGGMLVITRDAGNSFINFDSNNQFDGTDSTLAVDSTSTGFDFLVRDPNRAFPFITSSRLTINLNTPLQSFQDLISLFSINAGDEGDEIHSVQILDSATQGSHSFSLKDEGGVLHYLNLLDSIPYGDPRLTYTGGDNEVDIIGGQRLWQGIKGAKLANNVLEFDSNGGGLKIRRIGSRLRFRTRKAVPSTETGGAPSTYPLREGVSSPAYTLVSSRFVYKFVNASQAQGFTSGYVSGGTAAQVPNGMVNIIEKFPFATDANATPVGDLSAARNEVSGQSSTVSGYTAGGYHLGPGYGTRQNIIEKFPFATDANATDVGNLSYFRASGTGNSSTVSGYISGGSAPRNFAAPGYPVNSADFIYVIEKFPFATDTNATPVGNLNTTSPSVARTGPIAGNSSTESGYYSGGNTHHSGIQKFPFATDTNATPVGNLDTDTSGTTGQSSGVSGYVTGGGPPLSAGVIQKFPFATDTNAADVGDLLPTGPAATNSGIGQSGVNFGYHSGGVFASGVQNVIQKFSFASDQNATDVSDLTSGRKQGAGQQV